MQMRRFMKKRSLFTLFAISFLSCFLALLLFVALIGLSKTSQKIARFVPKKTFLQRRES
jgi:hypothetical protein